MLKNSTFIITGAGGRIGYSLTEAIISKGGRVIIGDINKKKILQLKNKLGKEISEKKLLYYIGDLTKGKNIKKLINKGLRKFKKIDGAIHCMYPKSKGWGDRFENIKEENLKLDLNNQLGGAIIFSQKILKYFVKVKKGNLIHISSIQGIRSPKFDHYRNLKMMSPLEYSAIKSGIISLTVYLAKYYKNKNLRINCVSPGGIQSNQPKKFSKRYRSSCNLKGLLDPKDIVDTILFLLSNQSTYINGQNIVVDDGWSL